MGMDVFGRNGAHFRRNVWGWRPLAEFCQRMAPAIAVKCEHWHSNDGDGLDGDDAAALADILTATVTDGRAQAYIALRDAELRALPQVPCRWCDATGMRTDAVGVDNGMPERVLDTAGHPRHGEAGWCNACDGHGSSPDFATHYRLDLDDIVAFAAFLGGSGGFEIC